MMIFKSAVFTEASGSYQGLTWSRNKGGAYIRSRVVPTNPGTSLQTTVRNALASLSNLWLSELSAAERSAWATYAENVPIINALGEAKVIPELAHFIRSNVPRLQGGLTRVDAGPTTFDVGSFTDPAITISTSNASVAFTNTDDWAGEVGSAMLVYASQEQNASINYFKGPYRYIGKISGAGTPPTSPATIALGFTPATGNKVFFQVRVSRADGRLSYPFRAIDVA